MKFPTLFTVMNMVFAIQEFPRSISEEKWGELIEKLQGGPEFLAFLEAQFVPFKDDQEKLEEIADGETDPLKPWMRDPVDSALNSLFSELEQLLDSENT
jgi:hypothetical protein